jgi:hypothetical protein
LWLLRNSAKLTLGTALSILLSTFDVHQTLRKRLVFRAFPNVST